MATIADLVSCIERDREARNVRDDETFGHMIAPACRQLFPREGNWKAQVRPGRKYTRVDMGLGRSFIGKYMVVNATGQIFGVKDGRICVTPVIDRGHQYGTLDTLADWYWGWDTAITHQDMKEKLEREEARVWKLANKAAWLEACKYDNIDPGALFVVFSVDNPCILRWDEVVQHHVDHGPDLWTERLRILLSKETPGL